VGQSKHVTSRNLTFEEFYSGDTKAKKAAQKQQRKERKQNLFIKKKEKKRKKKRITHKYQMPLENGGNISCSHNC